MSPFIITTVVLCILATVDELFRLPRILHIAITCIIQLVSWSMLAVVAYIAYITVKTFYL